MRWLLVLLLLSSVAIARDDGRYADSGLKSWFEKLESKKGNCCSYADGRRIEDVDWDVKDGQYRVWLNQQWIPVPEAAVVTEPNRLGPAIVWPYIDGTKTAIRCFMPGAGG